MGGGVFNNALKTKDMAGETDITILLRGLEPKLQEGSYVFIHLKNSSALAKEDILCEFREIEGYTLIIKKEKADELGYEYPFVAAWIILNIHSALDAVGLTAEVATALTKNNISCNIVAAFYHDHLFVPVVEANKALSVLDELSKQQ